MTRAAALRRWGGRAAAIRPGDLRALAWAVVAFHRLRPDLRRLGTRARVPLPPPDIPYFAIRTVALYLHVRGATCLERTLTLQSFLVAHDKPATIAIGVSDSDGFSAHAWLVDLDPPGESEGYDEITRLDYAILAV